MLNHSGAHKMLLGSLLSFPLPALLLPTTVIVLNKLEGIWRKHHSVLNKAGLQSEPG